MANRIFNSFYEDDSTDKYFFYNGKSSVIGLSSPLYYTKNKNNFAYTRVAFLKPIDIGDNNKIVYMNDDIIVNEVTPEEKTTYVVPVPIGVWVPGASNNTIRITWGNFHGANAKYNIYVDGELVRQNVVVAEYQLSSYDVGYHYVAVTHIADGRESEPVEIKTYVSGTQGIGKPVPTSAPTYPSIIDTLDGFRSINIHIEALAKANRILRNSVRAVVTNLTTTENEQIVSVYITEEQYTQDNNTYYGLGVWVNAEGIRYIMVDPQHSLALNNCPIDKEHHPSYYNIEYLCNDNIKGNYNALSLPDNIEANLIQQAIPKNKYIEDRLDLIEEKIKNVPFQYIQNSIWFDNTHKPTTGFSDVLPSSVQGASTSRIVRIDTVNKTFNVLTPGVYAIQIKNGFYSLKGDSQVELALYKGSQQIKESYLSIPIVGDGNGQKKNTCSSSVYVVSLTNMDLLKLKAKFSNTNITSNNDTIITITALQYT